MSPLLSCVKDQLPGTGSGSPGAPCPVRQPGSHGAAGQAEPPQRDAAGAPQPLGKVRCPALVRGPNSAGAGARWPSGAACAVLQDTSVPHFCPALQPFIMKPPPSSSTTQRSGVCVSHRAVRSSGVSPLWGGFAHGEFPPSQCLCSLGSPPARAAGTRGTTFPFSSRASRNIHILNYRYFSQIAYLCSVFIIILRCFAKQR